MPSSVKHSQHFQEKAFALTNKAAISDNKNQDYTDDHEMIDELDYSDSVNFEVPDQPTKRILLDYVQHAGRSRF